PRQASSLPEEGMRTRYHAADSSRTSQDNLPLWRLGFFLGFLFFRLLFPGFFLFGFLFLGLFLRVLLGLFQQVLLLLLERRASGKVLLTVKVHATVNQSFLHHGVGAHRIVVVDHQVGILPHFDGADALLDPKLNRGIDRYHFERLVVRQAAVAHGLRGFLIQVRRFRRIIRIYGDHDTAPRHQRRVVRDCVVGFDLVRPPIRECRG